MNASYHFFVWVPSAEGQGAQIRSGIFIERIPGRTFGDLWKRFNMYMLRVKGEDDPLTDMDIPLDDLNNVEFEAIPWLPGYHNERRQLQNWN